MAAEPGCLRYWDGFLLTVLSIDWALAQVQVTLVAWPLLGNLTCEENTRCARGDNMGWRYFMIAMGGITMIMAFLRLACFTMFESPKYLMGIRKDEEAVKVVHEIARRNGTTSSLTVADLEALGAGATQGISAVKALQRNLQNMVNLSDDTYLVVTYRNSLIIAVLGVPGCLLGGALVEAPYFGRKGTLSASTVLTGVFLFAFTTAMTSDALLAWNCAYNFMSNIMYAVLYSYTPEIFPTKGRGTGNALAAAANRVFGVMAPVIGMFAGLETAAPVYVSGGLFVAAGISVLLLPFEPRGKASL
ncbi:hypothetical protein FQN50_000205 [Emmonsiellopsis sp. PD_5]|nr:hypothetical protein FQN50_000205 [Emmonsiellopsis sp. PD_5]